VVLEGEEEVYGVQGGSTRSTEWSARLIASLRSCRTRMEELQVATAWELVLLSLCCKKMSTVV
jgi:hypothetical protein